MNVLAEVTQIAEQCGIPVETGIFSETAPDLYIVITPIVDMFELHADNIPKYDVQDVSVSMFSKKNYTSIKNSLVCTLYDADIIIRDRRYIGHEDDTGNHHLTIDVAKYYEFEIKE